MSGNLTLPRSIDSSEKLAKDEIEVVEQMSVCYDPDPEAVRKAWRKVDMYIMPVASILYLASYIDRANIGNARVLGLTASLRLTDSQYDWALSIFFIGYIVFIVPSNIFLKRIGPRYYIPAMTVIWGLTCALTARVETATGLLAIRFFLGVTEGGFLPGIIFWMGCWYPRSMQGRRFAIVYSTVSLTGSWGGLLATAIHALDGTHGIAGWRWIFIVEGCITIGLGLLTFVFMSSYPASAPFLTPAEREIIVLANEADRALKAREAFSGRQIRSAFTDWRVYVWALIFICTNAPVYSIILSLPSVITGLGYEGTSATLMACPPYGLGFVVVLIAGWSTDRYGKKYLHFAAGITVAMAALVVLMTVENLIARYIMYFFVMFMFVPICVNWSWLSSNVAGSNKRAAALGMTLGLGNIAGAISGQIYRAEWAPRYVPGHAINLAFFAIALGAGGVLWWSYRRDNVRRDLIKKRDGEKAAEHGDMLGEDLGDLGDRHHSFRYYL